MIRLRISLRLLKSQKQLRAFCNFLPENSIFNHSRPVQGNLNRKQEKISKGTNDQEGRRPRYDPIPVSYAHILSIVINEGGFVPKVIEPIKFLTILNMILRLQMWGIHRGLSCSQEQTPKTHQSEVVMLHAYDYYQRHVWVQGSPTSYASISLSCIACYPVPETPVYKLWEYLLPTHEASATTIKPQYAYPGEPYTQFRVQYGHLPN